MYCLNCIQFAIDYENTVPETVVIKELKEDNFLEAKESELTLIDIQYQIEHFDRQFDEINERLTLHLKDTERMYKRLNKLETLSLKQLVNLNSLEKTDMEDDILEEEAQKAVERMKSEEYFSAKENEMIPAKEFLTLEEFQSKLTSQEPDTTNEITESDTEEGVEFDEDHIRSVEEEFSDVGFDEGPYLVLVNISDENEERKFARRIGYKNTKELRIACGMTSLINLNYSTNRYMDRIDRSSKKVIEKVINKIFFGVPNIVEREVYKYHKSRLALIKKDQFEDKIEPVKYEVPTEDTSNIGFPEGAEIIKSDEETLPSVNRLIKGFVSDVVKDSEIKPKKRFSGRDIRDEYV